MTICGGTLDALGGPPFLFGGVAPSESGLPFFSRSGLRPFRLGRRGATVQELPFVLPRGRGGRPRWRVAKRRVQNPLLPSEEEAEAAKRSNKSPHIYSRPLPPLLACSCYVPLFCLMLTLQGWGGTAVFITGTWTLNPLRGDKQSQSLVKTGDDLFPPRTATDPGW